MKKDIMKKRMTQKIENQYVKCYNGTLNNYYLDNNIFINLVILNVKIAENLEI